MQSTSSSPYFRCHAVASEVGMKKGHAEKFKAWLPREVARVLGEGSNAADNP